MVLCILFLLFIGFFAANRWTLVQPSNTPKNWTQSLSHMHRGWHLPSKSHLLKWFVQRMYKQCPLNPFELEYILLTNKPLQPPNTTSWWFQPILKNISQIGSSPQIGVKIKNVWNQHLEKHYAKKNMFGQWISLSFSGSCVSLEGTDVAHEFLEVVFLLAPCPGSAPRSATSLKREHNMFI